MTDPSAPAVDVEEEEKLLEPVTADQPEGPD